LLFGAVVRSSFSSSGLLGHGSDVRTRYRPTAVPTTFG